MSGSGLVAYRRWAKRIAGVCPALKLRPARPGRLVYNYRAAFEAIPCVPAAKTGDVLTVEMAKQYIAAGLSPCIGSPTLIGVAIKRYLAFTKDGGIYYALRRGVRRGWLVNNPVLLEDIAGVTGKDAIICEKSERDAPATDESFLKTFVIQIIDENEKALFMDAYVQLEDTIVLSRRSSNRLYILSETKAIEAVARLNVLYPDIAWAAAPYSEFLKAATGSTATVSA